MEGGEEGGGVGGGLLLLEEGFDVGVFNLGVG
jgi:hypothetical protein